jgi:3-isopropylmalate/(R)-2-methylmalate dehydratase large subunit
MSGLTLFEKLWNEHQVMDLGGNSALIYIDRIFLHERTGSIALKSLRDAGRHVRQPRHVFCVMDHIVDTHPGRTDRSPVPGGEEFIRATRSAATDAAIELIDIDDPRQGIVHVVSPELGIVQPGITLVCPDSHTCSQGALGALAWGIGSSEAEHALATGTLRVARPKTMRVRFIGSLQCGVTAKDMILYLIATRGAAGGAGYAIEFSGEAVAALDVEARLTLCNMAVEFSAFTAIVAPDLKTVDYLQGLDYSPAGPDWEPARRYWLSLCSDDDALFDCEITIDCAEIEPMVTWGTSVEHACGISGAVPPRSQAGDDSLAQTWQQAKQYMGLGDGVELKGLALDGAFIGSCTNSRLSDLRLAAAQLAGRRVANGVRAICVPGSSQVKRQAEAEGLHKVFLDAGFEWRESGCSMCFFAGGESFGREERVVSSTNRNFESRQGVQVRTHLASPATVAASAVAGCLVDLREVAGHGN